MDRYKLEYEVKRKGLTLGELALKIGLSRSSLSRKMAGSTEFTLSEMQSIADVLNLDSPGDIFFKKKVS